MKYIKDNFFFILCLVYIILFISLRLKVKESRSLSEFNTTLDLFFCLFALIICLIRLILILKFELNLNLGKSNNEIFKYLSLKMTIVMKSFNDIWIKFFNILLQKFYNLNFFLLYITRHLYSLQDFSKSIIILLDIIPRGIVLILFLIDIFWFQKFYYFYCAIPLLLLPLLFNILFYMLLEFHITNIVSLENRLIINFDVENRKCTYKFVDDVILPEFVKDLKDFMLNHYLPLKDIPEMLNQFTMQKKMLKLNWITILITFCYAIGWSKVLILILI